MKRASLLSWPSSVIVLAASVALAVPWQLLTARGLVANAGCGFDGLNYCEMFDGHSVPLPYERRILAPMLASLLSPNAVLGFRVLSLLSLLAVIVLVGIIVFGRDLPTGPTATASVGVAVFAVVSLNRNLLHLLLSYPVLTDFLAFALLLLALLATLRAGNNFWWTVLAALAGILAPLARETMGIPLIGAALTALLMQRGRFWARYMAICCAAAVGTWIAFQRGPAGSVSVVSVMWGWVLEDFTEWQGALRFTCMLALTLGFFWLLLLRADFRDSMEFPEWVLLGAAVAYAAASAFGGGDTDRIMMPVGVLIFVSVARVTLRATPWIPALLLLSISFVLAQAPFQVVGTSDDAWISFFALRVAPWTDFVANGLTPVLLSLPFAVAAWFACPPRAVTNSGLGDAIGEGRLA